MRASLSRITDALSAFLAWWLRELAALVPRRLTQLLFPAPKFLVAEPGGEGLGLWYLRGARASRLKTVGLEDRPAAGVREQVREQVRRIDLKSAVTVLRLPADQGLRCRLSLPAAAEQDLRSALALQVDRQTPFTEENAAFDYYIIGRDRQAGQVSVEMAVAPRQSVQELCERARDWGLPPTIVDLAENAGTGDGAEVGPPRYNLIADAEQPAARRPWPLVNGALATLALLLLAAIAYLPVHRAQARADALSAQVAEASAAANAVISLRSQLDERQTESKLFYELKAGSPPKVLVLDELTRILPDDTWIQRLSISGREVRITGASPTASSLVSLIDESELFGTPRFLSTVTAESETGMESFKFSFELAVPAGGPGS